MSPTRSKPPKATKTGPATKRTPTGQESISPHQQIVSSLRVSPTNQQFSFLSSISSVTQSLSDLFRAPFQDQQEFHLLSKYLLRAVEDNSTVYALNLDEYSAFYLIMAYQDWVRTFRTDNSKMSVIMMRDFWEHIEKNAPEDFKILSQYYGPLDLNQKKDLVRTVIEIWKRYRTFQYYYNYSLAFQSVADNFGKLVDEGETPLQRTKLFYLWLVFFHGKENLFIDMGDRRLAAEHDKMNLTMESLIGLELVRDRKPIVPGFENLLALESRDIVVSQMHALLEYASPDVQEAIWSIIDLDSNTLSPAGVAEIRECKRRLFVSAPKTSFSPYTFCTRPGIANLDAKEFIANATKWMRKRLPGDWVEHMTISTYRYLEEHPSFRFGKENDKKTLSEWLVYLGYKTEESQAQEDVYYSEPVTSTTPECTFDDMEIWAWEIVHSSREITFPMPEGAFTAMEASLKQAIKYAGDEQTLKTILENKYVWVELLRKISEGSKALRRTWGSKPEFKKVLKFTQNFSDLL